LKAAGLFDPKSKVKLPERNDRALLKQGPVLSEKTFKVRPQPSYLTRDMNVDAPNDAWMCVCVCVCVCVCLRHVCVSGSPHPHPNSQIAERWLFLFDDYLVYAKGDKKSGKFELSVAWDLLTLRVDGRLREHASKHAQMAISWMVCSDAADVPFKREEIIPIFGVKTIKEKGKRACHFEQQKTPETPSKQASVALYVSCVPAVQRSG
jgi:hypothetical protein